MPYPDIFPGASDVLVKGYRYWCEKAAGRIAPTWRDIDPADIVSLLPNVVVVHVLSDPQDFVERIIGQTIVDHSHGNRMHQFWRSRPDCGPNSEIWRIMTQVVEDRQPSFNQVPYAGPNRDFVRIQTVVCPISDDGKTVNKTLSFVDFIAERLAR